MSIQGALRQFSRSKQYYLVVFFSLALTLALLFSVFSLVSLVFLKPLPYQKPDGLYSVEGKIEMSGRSYKAANPMNLITYKGKNQSFSGMSAYSSFTSQYRLYDLPERPKQSVLFVEHDLFQLLGVKPVLGRVFNKTEAIGNHQPSIVLGYQVWDKIYKHDPAIIGRKVQLDQRRFSVVGVLPDGLLLPEIKDINRSIWLPFDMDSSIGDIKKWQGYSSSIHAVARLKPEVTLQQANAEAGRLSALAASLNTPKIAAENTITADIVPLDQAINGDASRIVLMVLGGVILLILIAIINLSSMQLARAIARIKPIAISLSFGATRKQILIDAMKHNLLVIGLAALVALILAVFSFALIQQLASDIVIGLDTLGVDSNMILFTVITVLALSFLFSVIELSVVKELSLVESLQSSGKGSGKQMSQGVGHFIIGVQIVISFVTLVVALHVASDMYDIVMKNNGINTQNRWSLTVDFSAVKNQSSAERQNINRAIIERLRREGSIQKVAEVSQPRIAKGLNTQPVYDSNKLLIGSVQTIDLRASAAYLKSLELQIIGNSFTSGDAELKNYPILVNQRLAELITENTAGVLGQKITMDGKMYHEIIGVVGNTYYPEELYETGEIYTPGKYTGYWLNSYLLTTNGSELSRAILTGLLADVDKRLNIENFDSLQHQFFLQKKQFLIALIISATLAGFSLFMVLIGVSGMVAYLLRIRRYNMGVKMAMGASNRQLFKDSLWEIALPIFTSLLFSFSALFMVIELSKARFSLAVSPDWLLIISVLLGLLLLSLVSSFIPIRNILNDDPIKALRNE